MGRLRRHRFLAFMMVCLFAIAACTDDDPDARPPDGTGGGGGGSGSSGGNGDDVDIDADFDASDAGADADVDVGPFCELEPRDAATDFRFPCCFTDSDCHDSGAPDAEDLVCYHAVCAEGAEGICRVPPTAEMQCWGTGDCPDEHSCPYAETYQEFACDSPMIQELPSQCVDQSD